MKPPHSGVDTAARADGESRSELPLAAVATAEIAEGAAAVMDAAAPKDQAHFWRARAFALETELTTVRTQLLQLARCLPLAMAERLDSNETGLADLVAVDDLLDGWVETTTLWPSSVSAEMARLWSRLRHNHD